MGPHDVLGVAPGASPEQVRAAFRRFATTHHPDCGGDPDRFRAGLAAYRRLAAGAASTPAAVDVVFHRSRRGLRVFGRRGLRRARPHRHLR